MHRTKRVHKKRIMRFRHKNDNPNLILTAEETLWIRKNPIVKMSCDPFWPPYSMKVKDRYISLTSNYMRLLGNNSTKVKDRYIGLAPDYMRLLANKVGFHIKYISSKSAKEAFDKFKNNKIDIFPIIAKTKERARFMSFSKPYLKVPNVIVTRQSELFIESLKILSGKKVGIVKGFSTVALVRKDHPYVNIVEVDNVSSGLRQLSNGQLDAFIDSLASVTYTIKKEALSNLKVSGTTPYNFDLRIAINQNRPILQSIMNKALNSVTQEEHNLIYKKWLSNEYQKGIDYLDICIVTLLIIVIIIICLWWNRKLKFVKKDRDKIQKQLEQAEKLHQSIIDSMPDLISFKDLDGVYLGANQAYADFNKHSLSQILGKTDYDLFPKEMAKFHSHDEKEMMNCKGSLCDEDTVFDNSKDKSVVLETTKSSLLDENKFVKGIIVVSRDITERHESETQLRQLSSAVTQSPASVMITNTSGHIEYVNPKFCTKTGYSAAEVMGKNPRLLKSDYFDDTYYKDLWEVISQGREWKGEFLNVKKNGEYFWEFASISPIKNNAGEITHYLSIKEDITSRKKLELDLKAAKEKAEEGTKAKSEFLAYMSHEIRTPMNGIIGFSQLALGLDIEPRVKGYLNKINTSANSLLSIINDILDFSKIEAGKLNIEHTSFQLLDVLESLNDMFSQQINKKGIGL
ncbi:PAS domain S-box protein, partial [bacterium]|nr:PAS domain S-box protein [bacterium]